jgi:hypothetical protein
MPPLPRLLGIMAEQKEQKNEASHAESLENSGLRAPTVLSYGGYRRGRSRKLLKMYQAHQFLEGRCCIAPQKET